MTMTADPLPSLANGPGRAGAVRAVAAAATRTGVDFSFLLNQAQLESGLNPAAAARTSSARGLFQFTAGTWLDTVRRHGGDHGLGWAAAAIDGGLARAGSAMRATILGLRDNAEAASLMAGELARDNAGRLGTALGRAAGPTELYMAHFLGPGGAARFLGALAATPDAAAASVVPDAASTNRAVFYDGGRPRSLTEVFDRFAARFAPAAAPGVSLAPGSVAPDMGNDLPVTAGIAPGHGDEPDPDRLAARAAYMLLAELGG